MSVSSRSPPPKIILGAGGIGDASDPVVGQSTPEAAQEFLNIFRRYAYRHIDTARGYTPHAPGSCEPLLAKTDIATWATVDTKLLSHKGQHSSENITASLEASIKALHPIPINTLYLHWPDRSSPLLPMLRTINEHHVTGKFQSFGLSNYEADEVNLILSLCEQHNLIKPTSYQLHYNAITRSSHPTLIPTLRHHQIAISAWSPAAAGFFSKTRVRVDSATRLGQSIRNQYDKPALNTMLAQIHALADERGTTGHEIALRWILHHSLLDGGKGDSIVIGVRTCEQLEGTLRVCRDAGPLEEDVLALVERCWEEIEGSGDAPHFSPFPPKEEEEVLRA